MAENGRLIAMDTDKQWPAGREQTATFARELVELPAGFSILELAQSAQRQMQAGHAPRPNPADQLVACGLAEQDSGFLHPTPALRCALALFGASTDSA